MAFPNDEPGPGKKLPPGTRTSIQFIYAFNVTSQSNLSDGHVRDLSTLINHVHELALPTSIGQCRVRELGMWENHANLS